jgi:hypothetical protein
LPEDPLFSVRSACDAIASVLSYAASEKPGQAPSGSLRRLIAWANKNEARVHPDVLTILKGDLDWFRKLRWIRDQLAHGFADVVALRTDRQFDLILMSTQMMNKKLFREPMLPLLAQQLVNVVELSNQAADVVNQIIGFPLERKRSRVVCGVLIPALYKLVEVAPNYATPVE